MKITIVAGARPNFMKIAPIIHEIEKQQKNGAPIAYRLVHTGQHYDKNLSETFFEELGIPSPDVNLEVKSGSHARQTAAIMVEFELELLNFPTHLVLVVGDVTSTMACSIVAKKAGIKVAHVEAGIRSGDLQMPEEINRIVTDSVTDFFYTTSEQATAHLISIGKSPESVFFVGNVMIDTLHNNLSNLKKPKFWGTLGLQNNNYFVLTLHRPSNVDELDQFTTLLTCITKEARDLPIIFPVHPRTQKMLNEAKIEVENLYYVEPQSYLSFIYLVKNAKAILTDSGGITEEASILNVPCLTFRENTERPETIALGTNVLVGNNLTKIEAAFDTIFEGKWKNSKPIPKWDGKASQRIVESILKLYDN